MRDHGENESAKTHSHSQTGDTHDPDLARVVASWGGLAPPLRAAVMAIVASQEAVKPPVRASSEFSQDKVW